MTEFSENGLTMLWADAVPDAARRMQRVLVQAKPASPANVLHLIYSVAGGPERRAQGWPVGTDPETGMQAFAADLPVLRDGVEMVWRPVLQHGFRMLDPKAANLQQTIGKAPAPMPEAPAKAALPPGKTVAQLAAAQDTKRPKFPFSPTYLFRVFAPFDHDVQSVGETPDGVRMYFRLRGGGLVRGPAMNGDILSGGGDWMRIREDGIGIADVHALIRVEDGSMLLTEYSGVCDFGAIGIKALAAGHLPSKVEVRLCPRYLTSSPKWAWLNRIQGFSVGQAHLDDLVLEYDEYHVPIAGERSDG